MKNFQKIGLIGFLSLYLFSGLLLFIPNKSLAALIDVNRDITFTPQIGVPGSEFTPEKAVQVGQLGTSTKGESVMRSDLLGRYIKAAYDWGLSIVGIIAVVVLMAGGLMWIVSGGKSEMIGKAKTMISGSLTGLALLIGSYFLLNTINPNLTNLPPIEMVIISRTSMGCCLIAKDDGQAKMTMSNNCKSGFDLNKSLINGKCESEVCCIYNNSATGVACFKSFANSCSIKVGGVTGTYKEGACSAITECKRISTCDGVTDGKTPGDSFSSTNYLYCYNGRLYPTTGAQLNEPCGVKSNGYGICIKSDAKCRDQDQLGGRKCGSGVMCCLD